MTLAALDGKENDGQRKERSSLPMQNVRGEITPVLLFVLLPVSLCSRMETDRLNHVSETRNW